MVFDVQSTRRSRQNPVSKQDKKTAVVSSSTQCVSISNDTPPPCDLACIDSHLTMLDQRIANTMGSLRQRLLTAQQFGMLAKQAELARTTKDSQRKKDFAGSAGIAITGNGVTDNTIFAEFRDTMLAKSKRITQRLSTQTAAADTRYSSTKKTKKFLGNMYRDEWAQPLEFPILDFATCEGGLRVVTKLPDNKGLVLISQDGRQFTLTPVARGITTPVEDYLPAAKNTFVEDFAQSVESGRHPYATIVTNKMGQALGFSVTHPEYFFVSHSSLPTGDLTGMRDTVCLLEECGLAYTDAKNGTSKEHMSDWKTVDAILKDDPSAIDAKAYLRFRLFGVVVGNWIQDGTQSSWSISAEEGDGKVTPMICQNQEAFSTIDGLIPSIINVYPKYIPFQAKRRKYPGDMPSVDHLIKFGHLDRRLLASLSSEDYTAVAKEIRQDLTDETIEQAFSAWPDIIQEGSTELIEECKRRRDQIVPYAQKLYSLLAQRVAVSGSENSDRFVLRSIGLGRTQVTVYSETGDIIYQRILHHSQTEELHLYGNGGDDIYNLRGLSNFAPDVHMGNTEAATVQGGRKGDVVHTAGIHGWQVDNKDVEQREDDRMLSLLQGMQPGHWNEAQGPNQPDSKLPFPWPGYELKTGLYAILPKLDTELFGNFKQPFELNQEISTAISLRSLMPLALYLRERNEAIGSLDTRIDGYFNWAAWNFFYGMGNDTAQTPDTDEAYHRFLTRELMASYSILQAGREGQALTGGIGAKYQLLKIPQKENTFLSDNPQPQAFAPNHAIGLFANAMWDSDNNVQNGGVRITGDASANLDFARGGFCQLAGSVAAYQRLHGTPFTLAGRIGAGSNVGETALPYRKTLDELQIRSLPLGRFAGTHSAYANAEVRAHMGHLRNSILPLDWGITGFLDAGRVWDGNPSQTIHGGVGAGVYLLPFGKDEATIRIALAKYLSLRGKAPNNMAPWHLSFGMGQSF